ncbi:MAG: bifunctional (p)ppGpp synthetase/guanosine-3',5'-bis(diphosphate) 3'-pyrophosphohydrolase [Fibrobacteraceae bacterium]
MQTEFLQPTQEHIISVLMKKNPSLNEEMLRSAVAFIAEAHKGQFRKSGMPYTEHPYEVAKILADLKLDTSSVLAGLLHDVVEDTPHTLSEIKTRFGEDTAFMVDAVTKISAAQKQDNKVEQKAETYRKFITAMAKDPRVIMIKIADRLHNMRTLQYMKPEKRRIIAQETLDIYTPLTHRFGLYQFKSELEDLAFKYINPVEYKRIIDHLLNSKEERERYIKSVIGPLQIKMALEDFDCTIQGRTKNIYSIYGKMQSRGCGLDDIFDIFAIRIIVETIPECYLALGYVHNLWTPLQGLFKDYIATPKPNLYQSIHTTVIGPENKMVEVQIRTKDMDLTAEKGFAAHWAYKLETQRSGEELSWLERLAKLQSEIPDSVEFLDFLRVDLKPEGITVFTPKGDSIELPDGSTVLDFAFAVHTDLGLHCVGARINNNVISATKVVPNGATIQVLKSHNQEPKPEWLEIVRTVKAKQELRRWMRTSISQESRILGKELWERELRVFKIQQAQQPSPESICKNFGTPTLDAFYERLGQGEMPLSDLQKFIAQIAPQEYKENSTVSSPVKLFLKDQADETNQLPVEVGNEASLLIHFASCCTPIPGEDIVGALIPKRGIEVHKKNCPELKKVPTSRLIAMEWNVDSKQEFRCHLRIETDNRKGITADILTEISKANAFLERMSVVSARDAGRIRMEFRIFRREQLEHLISRIEHIQGIREVKRI